MERKNLRGLRVILGATRANIERNVLQPMRDIYGDGVASSINSQNIAKILGEKVYCIGADNIRQVAKIRGSEIAYVAIDEATDINMEVFEMLKSRLSLPWSIADITTNPSSPNHWFKQFLDSAERGVDIYCQNYTIYDNPFLPKEYVKALEAEYAGSVWFDRYILGAWTLAEGLIYPNFLDAIYTENPPEPISDFAISIDYGTSNPFAALKWEKRGDTWYAPDELYYSGRDTGVQKTDDEYMQMLELFAQERIQFNEEHKTIDAWGNEWLERIPVIIDPSAASFIALIKRSRYFKVIPADNDVSNGIRNTSTAMRRGLIKIHSRCKNWRKEVQGYVWDTKALDERPVKEADHLMDSKRYFVNTMRLVKPIKTY
jgi:PBSX family phage terminase large subunit